MRCIKDLWSKIPIEWRKELTSASHTFGSTLVVTLLAEISAGKIPSTRDALIALCVTALRAAWKATVNALIVWFQIRKDEKTL